ncbi:uncharacterized protein SPSK_01655 [Sporothrix schenckii 1099-18]|uniref:Arrestin-like N-terminal domain-containing protein n=1 Tax=Sporothrix schenckii 1099-18 TaxID=1397361 RepID=A0A0F2MDI3_SPOSC|nr:uncharacterized protein SPSK_01655 [Sporothrix schenckii 1099-18]KJR87144.1 hypothetical protein SPSK_01655 [Sporothrix schenckii 1099-18]
MTGISDSGSSSSNFSGSGPHRSIAFPKSKMEIQLDNYFKAKVYTSGDSITGTVTIVPQRNIPFDEFEIVLLGTTHTRVEHVSAPIESSHVFLKLFMPIAEDAYPVPRVLEAHQTYTLPIHFVVPHHLTLSACNHKVVSPHVHDHHTRLPPTLGRGNGSGAAAAWERDDMAPEMARVEYVVKARVYRETLKEDGSGRSTRVKIVEATQPIRVLPASKIDPPLSVSEKDRAYKLQSSKSIRKGLFARSKLGRVTAITGDDSIGAPEPTPIVLRPDGIAASPTNAYVQLYFDPARPDVAPPRVTSVSAKLNAHTYYSTGAITTFPNLGDWAHSDNVLMERRGSYSTSVTLLNNSLKSFQWEAQVDNRRRDSGYCSSDSGGPEEMVTGNARRRSSAASPSNSKEMGLVYAAPLIVPLELPMHKRTFLPTFHSCIASRTYSLQLNISMVPASSTSSSSSSSSSGSTTTVSLSVPVQIVVGDANDASISGMPNVSASQYYYNEDAAGLPSFDDALEEAEADAHLMPRVMAVPDAQYQETSVLPGYSGRQ